MKKLIRKIIYKERASSKDYCEYLNSKGISVGKGTYFFDPKTTKVDTQMPYLLSIGEYCKITAGVTILAHDYSRAVLRLKYGEVIGEAKETKVGNNVFIGINTVVLMGANIGNNVIIGANSVVSGRVPDDVVVAGNPAKVIMTLDEYYTKRKSLYIEEAKNYARVLHEKTGRVDKKLFSKFAPLFIERDLDSIKNSDLHLKLSGDNYEDLIENLMKSKPVYNSFEEFVDDSIK